MTTDHLNLEASRSFDRPINTPLPKPLALLDIIDFIWFLTIFLLFVYSVYLGYEPEGSTSQYYLFISICPLAIRTLGTLPCTWVLLLSINKAEHHITKSCIYNKINEAKYQVKIIELVTKMFLNLFKFINFLVLFKFFLENNKQN